MPKPIRLDRFLAEAGIGTRSEVKKVIQKGQVLVNGVPAKKPEQKITVPPDEVICNGEAMTAAEEFVYYLLHKPAGVVSATEDKKERTVLDLLPTSRRALFPVGRLDKDTEGLLLITDDGALAHALLSPKRHVDKQYYVIAQGTLTETELHRLEEGVDIGEKNPTLPAKAELILTGQKSSTAWKRPQAFENSAEPITELLLTIHEGKFHQVKRMLTAVGSQVLYLRRVRMGTLTLPGDLAPGEYCKLEPSEIAAMKEFMPVHN